jgi:hypothetical protein
MGGEEMLIKSTPVIASVPSQFGGFTVRRPAFLRHRGKYLSMAGRSGSRQLIPLYGKLGSAYPFVRPSKIRAFTKQGAPQFARSSEKANSCDVATNVEFCGADQVRQLQNGSFFNLPSGSSTRPHFVDKMR